MNAPLDRSVAPKVHPLPRLSLPDAQRLTTPGGIPLAVLREATCDAPVFQLRVLVAGMGSFDMPPAVASVYPRMINQGSETLTADDLSEIFEGSGAWLNVGQQNHHLDIVVRGLISTAEEVVAALATMLSTPVFPSERLSVVSENTAMHREVAVCKPKVVAREAAARLLWGANHPEGNPPSADAIRRITRDDPLAAHSHFRPENLSLSLSGHITDGLVKMVERAFDNAFSPPETTGNSFIPHLLPPIPSPAIERYSLSGTRQAAIAINIPAIPRSHPDYEMLRLAVTGLGGYFGSRLNAELREERGLTYGVNAALVGSLDGAFMTASTECRLEAADEAYEAIEAEIARFIEMPPEGEELNRLLGFASSRLASILDSPFTIMDTAVVQQATIGTPADYFDRTQQAIASATPEALSRVVATHLAAGRCSAIVV